MGKTPFTKPSKISEYPRTPHAPAGQTPQSNSGWRAEFPQIDKETCTRCGMCTLWCPDGAISSDGDGFPDYDNDWCKGCGICAEECPVHAITMTGENR